MKREKERKITSTKIIELVRGGNGLRSFYWQNYTVSWQSINIYCHILLFYWLLIEHAAWLARGWKRLCDRDMVTGRVFSTHVYPFQYPSPYVWMSGDESSRRFAPYRSVVLYTHKSIGTVFKFTPLFFCRGKINAILPCWRKEQKTRYRCITMPQTQIERIAANKALDISRRVHPKNWDQSPFNMTSNRNAWRPYQATSTIKKRKINY